MPRPPPDDAVMEETCASAAAIVAASTPSSKPRSGSAENMAGCAQAGRGRQAAVAAAEESSPPCHPSHYLHEKLREERDDLSARRSRRVS